MFKFLLCFCLIYQISSIDLEKHSPVTRDRSSSGFVGAEKHIIMNSSNQTLHSSNRTLILGEISVANLRNQSESRHTTDFPVTVTLGKPPARRRSIDSDISAECRQLFRLVRRIWQGLGRNEAPSNNNHVTARHKNAYQKSFPIIIIAFMMMLAFVIPMGFQFMVMVGGKALLLSQMALIFGLSGAFKKWNLPEFTSYELPWNRLAGEPTPNRFDTEVPLRKTSNKHVEPYQLEHNDFYKLPYI